ncbi:MAG: hypothetical protein AAB842_01880 [Patescibacteria group bacterium]
MEKGYKEELRALCFNNSNTKDRETLDSQIRRLRKFVKKLGGEIIDYEIKFDNYDKPIEERSGKLLALISYPKMAKRQIGVINRYR